ncbi:MAG: hypothetical protein A2Z29_05495 [Chloroflexi bacterium RBG_16_56_11]|nr:MAG: hypothetical protein A2Z29_05495 [Chloroflexi bacterium RBG_16_56_11]
MDTKKKFLELLDGVDFRYGAAVDSPDQLVNLGQHVLTQYEALGEERQQRAYDLMCVILADVLQPRALARWHDASFNSIRRVLVEEFTRLGIDTIWEKYQQLAKQAIANLGLNDFQMEQLNTLFDLMPDIVVEFIARLASRFDFLPRENAAILALVLRDMFQEEANHAESKRHN